MLNGESFLKSLGWPERLIVFLAVLIAIGTAAIISPSVRAFFIWVPWLELLTAIGTVGAVLFALWATFRDSRRADQERTEETAVLRAVARSELIQFGDDVTSTFWVLSNVIGSTAQQIIFSKLDGRKLDGFEFAAKLPVCTGLRDRLHRLPVNESHAIASILGRTLDATNACKLAQLGNGRDSGVADFMRPDIHVALQKLGELASLTLKALDYSKENLPKSLTDQLDSVVKKAEYFRAHSQPYQ